MSLRLRSFALAGLIGLAVAGCSSEPRDRLGLTLVQSFVQRTPTPGTRTSEQLDAAISTALAATNEPLALATFEKTQNNVILRQIAANGPYRTWSNAGSVERRTLSTRNGMLTSTRGLAEDLMSSDISQSLALVSARQSGTATRVQRYLDGENQIFEVRTDCTISRGEEVRVRVGGIDRSAVQMTESCQNEDRNFTNIYSVDASGRVLQSVQWLNDIHGATVIQQLR